MYFKKIIPFSDKFLNDLYGATKYPAIYGIDSLSDLETFLCEWRLGADSEDLRQTYDAFSEWLRDRFGIAGSTVWGSYLQEKLDGEANQLASFYTLLCEFQEQIKPRCQ